MTCKSFIPNKKISVKIPSQFHKKGRLSVCRRIPVFAKTADIV